VERVLLASYPETLMLRKLIVALFLAALLIGGGSMACHGGPYLLPNHRL
jgi:hypothetical protein